MNRVARSFMHAGRGIGHVLRNETNARIHLVAMIAVIVSAALLHVTAEGVAALLFAVALVLFAEILNSAVEKTLDLVHPERDERVRIIKDMTAGGVLVTAIAAVAIAVVVFVPAL